MEGLLSRERTLSSLYGTEHYAGICSERSLYIFLNMFLFLEPRTLYHIMCTTMYITLYCTVFSKMPLRQWCYFLPAPWLSLYIILCRTVYCTANSKTFWLIQSTVFNTMYSIVQSTCGIFSHIFLINLFKTSFLWIVKDPHYGNLVDVDIIIIFVYQWVKIESKKKTKNITSSMLKTVQSNVLWLLISLICQISLKK